MAGRPKRPRPPLDEDKLNELMLAYVAKFATSRAKLGSYLRRKVRERGWEGAGEPPVEALVAKAAGAGFVDDAAFALGKSRSLTARGYGARRVTQALQAAGIDDSDGMAARNHARTEAADAALQFARRRRFGPFAAQAADPQLRERQLAAMVRAGHGFGLAKAIIALPPGGEVDRDGLQEIAAQSLL